MRLIDADLLCYEMKSRQTACEEWKNNASDDEARIRAEAVLSAFVEFKLTIDAMPTIEEHKTGRWIYYPKASGSVTSTAVHLYPVCSECGCEHPVSRYCPNCGAKMEVEHE